MLLALVLGIIQGVTEFFPVSSTAHLVLVPWALGVQGTLNTLSFDVALHVGTLGSLVVCFWRDWADMLFKDRRPLRLIAVATVPAAAAGLILKGYVEGVLRGPVVIAVSLVLFGVLMLVAERVGGKVRMFGEIGLRDAVVIGLVQAVALVPGVSRSGITIAGGLFMGLGREASARFSFLMAAPVVLGAAVLELPGALGSPLATQELGLFAAGLLGSFTAGIFAIKYLMRFLRKYPLDVFVYYRFMLSALVMVLWLRA